VLCLQLPQQCGRELKVRRLLLLLLLLLLALLEAAGLVPISVHHWSGCWLRSGSWPAGGAAGHPPSGGSSPTPSRPRAQQGSKILIAYPASSTACATAASGSSSSSSSSSNSRRSHCPRQHLCGRFVHRGCCCCC